MYEKVRELLASQLEIERDLIDIDTDIIVDLGADSLDIVELITSIEDEYGLIITDENVGDLHTVRQVVDFLDNLMD